MALCIKGWVDAGYTVALHSNSLLGMLLNTISVRMIHFGKVMWNIIDKWRIQKPFFSLKWMRNIFEILSVFFNYDFSFNPVDLFG